MLKDIITEVIKEWADSDTPVSQDTGGWGKAPGSPFAGKGVTNTGVLSNESQQALSKWKKCVLLCIKKYGRKYNSWPSPVVQLCMKYGNAVEGAMGQPMPPNANQPGNSNAGGYVPNVPFSGPF